MRTKGDEEDFLTGTRCGGILAQRWGTKHSAQHKVAQAAKRLDYILNDLSDEDADIAMGWLKGLPPDLEASIWIMLVEG